MRERRQAHVRRRTLTNPFAALQNWSGAPRLSTCGFQFWFPDTKAVMRLLACRRLEPRIFTQREFAKRESGRPQTCIDKAIDRPRRSFRRWGVDSAPASHWRTHVATAVRPG